MSLLFGLDIAGLIISTMIASALMVLGFRLRHTLNYFFILFTSVEATWTVCALLLRLALLLEVGNPSPIVELAALTFGLMSPLLLMFTVRYLGRPTRWVDRATVTGLMVIAALSIPLFRHQLIFNPRLDARGLTVYDISGWGFMLASLPVLYMVWSLVLFWQERRRVGEPYLALSVLALLIGFVVGGVLEISFPIRPIMNTLSVFSLGYGVISRQLFNPLQELTEELEQRGEERTQELAEAAAQLTAIYTLGQKLVLSRNAVEIAQLVVDAAQQVLSVSICGLWMIDEEQKRLTLWAHTDGTAVHKIPSLLLNSERSIIAAVARSGELIYLPDVSQDPRYLYGDFLSRSELCVPLRVGRKVIGVLNTESENLDGFGPADRQLLEALANSAAIAIHNARLHAETRKQTERLAVVNHIASVTGVTLHMDDLMEMVYLEIVPAFHPDAFFIALYDEETNELNFCFEVDGGVRQPPARLPLGVGFASLVVADRQPLLIRDIEREKDRLPPQMLSGTGKPAVSWLGAPMLIGERVIGVTSVQAYRSHAWGEEDELLLSTIADQVAVALEKAHLFQERERRVTELAIVNEIGQAVSSTSNMDTLLETVHQQVSRLFDTTNFYIATYEEESREWMVVYYIEYGQPQPTGRRHEIEAGLSGYIIRNRQHLLFYSGEEIVAFQKAQGIESIGPMAHSWLGVPLIAADKVVGMMGIQNYEQENLYDEQDLALFSTIAAQVAPALDNLRLLEETRDWAQEMEVINKVGQAITSVLDLDGVLRQIVDTTKTRFGHYFVGIALLKGDQLIFQNGSTIGDSNTRLKRGQLGVALMHEFSLVAEAGRTGQPVLAHDTLNDPRFLPVPELPDTRCELCLPIRAKGRVIGVLDVQSDRPFAYDQSDVALLQSLADQAGVAIENARLFEEARTHAEELAVLNELGQALTARLDVEEVLDEAYRQTSRLLDTTNFYIGLYDPEKHEIHFALDVSESSQDEDITTISADQGIGGYIVHNRTSVLIQENLLDWEKERGIESVGEPALSWMGVPLMIGDQVLGVMAVQSYTTPHLYDEHDRDLLTAIASQAAIAIHNAQLYEQAQYEIAERRQAEEALKQRNRELSTLYEATTAISSDLSLDIVLQTVAEQMTRALNSSGCALSRWKRRENLLEVLVDYSTTWPDDTMSPGETYNPNDYPTLRRMLETGHPVIIQHDDLTANEAKLAYMEKWKIFTLLALPLIAHDQVVGLVELHDDVETRDYTPEDIRLAQSLAAQAAIAIENAQLYEQARHEIVERKRAEEEAQRRAAQAALVYEVGRRVSGELELETLLSEIVTAVRDAFDYYSVLLMLLDEDTERLTLQSVAGGYADVFPRDLWVAIGEGMTGRAAATGDAQISGDVSQNPHYVRKAEEKTESELAVPIKSGQKVIGVLDLQSDELAAFDETDVLLMETLADQIAAAIENARLYEETQQRLREQTMLFDASQRLASAPLQVEEIAEVSVRQLAGVMESTECSFSLPDPQEEGTLRVVAGFWTEDGIEHWQEGKESFNLSDYPATAHVTETLQPLVIQASDPNADPAELAYMQENETATLSIIPLTVKGQAIGVMELETEEEHHYTPEQLSIAMTLANQAAVALENARLYEAVQQELTERKRAEGELRSSEERLRILFESAPDAYYLNDLKGIFIDGNKAAERLIGYQKEELIGKSFLKLKLLPPKQIPKAAALLARNLLGQPTGPDELTLNRKDGKQVTVEIRTFPVKIKGQTVVLGIARDTTERRRTEEQLRRYAVEMERANEEVKRFAYIVSHDLRAPLLNMKGFASELRLALDEIQSVMSTALPHLNEEQKQTITYALQEDAPEALEFINSSVTRMDHFINALLKLSRLGRRELKLEPVDVSVVVQAILPTMAHQIAERQVKVTVGTLPEVIADQTSMEQIIGNILGNAVKYLSTDRPGEIEITAERGDDETIFRIRDNGRGIAEGDMDKVFAPFRRAGRQDVPGEGMGLAYVQALIRRHGGRIWCESELGVETTFTFTISNRLEEGDDHA